MQCRDSLGGHEFSDLSRDRLANPVRFLLWFSLAHHEFSAATRIFTATAPVKYPLAPLLPKVRNGVCIRNSGKGMVIMSI